MVAAGFWIGAWAGVTGAALVIIAVNTSYESQAIVAGLRFDNSGIAVVTLISAVVWAIIGAAVGEGLEKRSRASQPAASSMSPPQ